MGGQASRKSSVPPGTHRSPSHVTAPGSPTPGSPAPGSSGAPSQAAAGVEHIAGGVTGNQARTDRAGTPPKAGGPFKSKAIQPGMAGTPSKGAAPSKPGTAQPGTAGRNGPEATTRFTQVASQRVQGGDTTAKVQAAEQNAISVGQKQPSPGAMRPGSQPPGISAEQKAQPGKTVTRFTQRESREAKIGQQPTASQAAKAAQTPSSVQSGTAGTGAAPAADHSTRATRHGRDVPSPVGSTTHITQTATSPARQEPGKAPEVSTPSVKGSPVQPRPGTAGTAPTAQQAAQTRQTARGQTLRAKSTPMATDSLGGKKTASTASAAAKGRLTPKGPVTPKVQQPTKKRADRPPRKGGGGERGK